MASLSGRFDRGPVQARTLRDLNADSRGSYTAPFALGVAVACSLVTIASGGAVLATHNPVAMAGMLYLVATVVLAALWGASLTIATAVACTAGFAYFAGLQDVEWILLAAATFVGVGVTTNVVSRKSWTYGVDAPEHWASLDRVGKEHQARRLRIGSVLRVATVLILLTAMLVSPSAVHSRAQAVLVGIYAVTACWAVVLAFSPRGSTTLSPGRLLGFVIADVAAVYGFQLLSDGGLVPLLVLGVVPFIVVPQVSWRRAAVVDAISVAAFVVVVCIDPAVLLLGWATTAFIIALYIALCGVALTAAYAQEQHFAEITELSDSRRTLLSSTMTAADDLQRRVAEAIHDGAMQDLLAARQELLDLAAASPAVQTDRAIASLAEASDRLREAIFELHPVIVEQLGLAAAIEKLADATAHRSGIEISAIVDEVPHHPVDPIVFGAVRELLSNVARHSGARRASVTLACEDDTYRVDVRDDGVGFNPEVVVQQLAGGHIGLASHQARIEAAGGAFRVLEPERGSHIRVEVPLRRSVVPQPA